MTTLMELADKMRQASVTNFQASEEWRDALAAAFELVEKDAKPIPEGYVVVPKTLLREARDNCKASIAEDGISGMRKDYRIELEQRLDAAIGATK